jgi:hypothetical protein
MSDSLTVERAEMLKMIGKLEEVVADLGDDNAGVSKKYAQDLHRLRNQVVRAQSPQQWRPLVDFAVEVMAKIAAEILKAWF